MQFALPPFMPAFAFYRLGEVCECVVVTVCWLQYVGLTFKRTDEDPEGLTHPSHSSAIIRLARIDFPLPGPPHSSRKKVTSWNLWFVLRLGSRLGLRLVCVCVLKGFEWLKAHGSNACMCISSMILTSRPAMFTPLEKRRMRKARWCPKGVRSVATRDCLCAKPILAVPRRTFGSSGLTVRPRPHALRRRAISPASLTASLSPTCATS